MESDKIEEAACSPLGAARAEARKRVTIEKVKRMVEDAFWFRRCLNV